MEYSQGAHEGKEIPTHCSVGAANNRGSATPPDAFREEQIPFSGQGPKNPTMSNGTICKALEGMGYKGEMTGHGFRGVASTIMHECGHRHEYIEAQMAHQKKDKVSGAYDHAKYLIPRTYMMQDWADFLDDTLRSRKYKLIPPPTRLNASKGQMTICESRSAKRRIPNFSIVNHRR